VILSTEWVSNVRLARCQRVRPLGRTRRLASAICVGAASGEPLPNCLGDRVLYRNGADDFRLVVRPLEGPFPGLTSPCEKGIRHLSPHDWLVSMRL